MKLTLTAVLALAALILSGCAAVVPDAVSGPEPLPAVSAEVPTPEPTPEPPPTVDVTDASAHTFPDGLTITYNGAAIAALGRVFGDPNPPGSQPVTMSFTYTSTAAEPIPLQQAPFTVQYGANLYDAEKPTLYSGDPTRTELPAQIVPGTAVDAVNTYWIPAGEPTTVTVDASGVDDHVRPSVKFTGIHPR